VRVSQKSNQHGQEERCVNHENASGIEEASTRMYDYTGIQNGVVRRFELVFCMAVSRTILR
jgi:hypothetical protein